MKNSISYFVSICCFIALFLVTGCTFKKEICSDGVGAPAENRLLIEHFFQPLVENGADELKKHIIEATYTDGAYFRIGISGDGSSKRNYNVIMQKLHDSKFNKDNSILVKIDNEGISTMDSLRNMVMPITNKQTVIEKFGTTQDIKVSNEKGNEIFCQANMALPKPIRAIEGKASVQEFGDGVALAWKPENCNHFAILMKCSINLSSSENYRKHPLSKVYITEDDGSFVIPKADYAAYNNGLASIDLLRWNSTTASDTDEPTRKNVFFVTSHWSQSFLIN